MNVIKSQLIAESGHAVFSQVTMSHPINQVLKKTAKSETGRMWAPIDAIFLNAMEELIILDLEGWDQSAGIKRDYAGRKQNVSLWSEVEGEFK